MPGAPDAPPAGLAADVEAYVRTLPTDLLPLILRAIRAFSVATGRYERGRGAFLDAPVDAAAAGAPELEGYTTHVFVHAGGSLIARVRTPADAMRTQVAKLKLVQEVQAAVAPLLPGVRCLACEAPVGAWQTDRTTSHGPAFLLALSTVRCSRPACLRGAPSVVRELLHLFFLRCGQPPDLPIRYACFGCGRTEPRVRLQYCARCGNVRYCGPGCQRADWPNHRLTCVPK